MFSPRGEGFALSSRICIYDENNCLSEIQHPFFFKGKKSSVMCRKKMHVPENNLFVSLLWWSFFFFRFSPMVFLYLSTVIPSIWFLELGLLQSKTPGNNSLGPELHLLAHLPITAVGVPPPTCPPYSHIKASPYIR